MGVQDVCPAVCVSGVCVWCVCLVCVCVWCVCVCGCVCPGVRVSMGGGGLSGVCVCPGVCVCSGCVSGGVTRGCTPLPPVNRMIDRCKNITFKQLRLRAVIKTQSTSNKTTLFVPLQLFAVISCHREGNY